MSIERYAAHIAIAERPEFEKTGSQGANSPANEARSVKAAVLEADNVIPLIVAQNDKTGRGETRAVEGVRFDHSRRDRRSPLLVN